MVSAYRKALMVALISFSPTLASQELDCGEPPPVSDEELKAQMEGHAKLLTGKVGEAGISGQVEKSKKDIFAKYPNADQVVQDRYLLYQMCILIRDDPNLTYSEKVDKLIEIRRELAKPIYPNQDKPSQ